jgi:trans-aconitate 2-methyltransferase
MTQDWSPETYSQFRGPRVQPALDLLARVADLPKGHVIDLGCGDGGAAAALALRFPERKIIGVDSSRAMISTAAATGAYHRCDLADIAGWTANKPPALIFSNAVLHWLPDYMQLLPKLVKMLAPGGTLAVQLPRQWGAPSHRFLRDFAGEMFPDLFDFTHWRPPVSPPIDMMRLIGPLGAADVWETKYLHRLPRNASSHPVRAFTQSTAMRPFAELLSDADLARLIARYDTALASAYPLEPDGSVLFPFRRTFFTVTV